MPKGAVLLALVTGAVMALAGASPWLALGVVAVWLGSLWLARPEPSFEQRSERKFTVSRESIAPFIERLGVPLLLLDGERIVAANKAAREALGAHVSGQDARIALRHPEAVALLDPESPSPVEVSGLTGPRSLWQLSRFAIDGRYRLIECVNRTAEADISRAHTDFVANASHELRTPLASVLGYLEILREGGKVDAAKQAKFLGTMEGEARRMQALVEDLLSLSRIEAEKHSAPQDRVDMSALVAGVARDTAAVRGEDRIKAAVAEGLEVAGDRAQLDQLVRNLIDNALKYGDPQAAVEVGLSGDGRHVVIKVADKGQGIAPEHLPLLTRRFYRTDPGRSKATGGTGLGLAIVKHIVERHRGTLDIASELGVGTTVTVRLPRFKQVSQ